MIQRLLLISALVGGIGPVRAESSGSPVVPSNTSSSATPVKVDKLDELYYGAALNVAACAMKYGIADSERKSHGVNSAVWKSAIDDAVACRDKELRRSKEAIAPLKVEVEPKPNAVAALKEFYTYWRASLYNLSYADREPIVHGLRSRIERVHTELEW